MSDKRTTDRTPTNISAHLISQSLNVSCIILDMSSDGARLQIAAGLFLPKVLTLRATDLGGDRHVEVVWRNKTQLGVTFFHNPDHS